MSDDDPAVIPPDMSEKGRMQAAPFLFFFFTLATGPIRFLSLKLSDTRVYEPSIRGRLGKHNTTMLGFMQADPFHP
jgi:hypothetical protein